MIWTLKDWDDGTGAICLNDEPVFYFDPEEHLSEAEQVRILLTESIEEHVGVLDRLKTLERAVFGYDLCVTCGDVLGHHETNRESAYYEVGWVNGERAPVLRYKHKVCEPEGGPHGIEGEVPPQV